MSSLPVLAHAGHGAEWQSVLTLVAIGLGGVLALVLLGRVRIEEGGDLVVPLAVVALLAAAAPVDSDTLSDLSPWAAPAGAVILVGLLLHGLTALDITEVLPLAGLVAVAAVASVAAGPALTDAWIPEALLLPSREDVELTITSPQDGATVEGPEVEFEVEVTGGTVGPPVVDAADAPEDPEELGRLRLTVDGVVVDPHVLDGCTLEDPCTTGTFTYPLAPGVHRIFVEFVTWDDLIFQPGVVDGVTIEVVEG
ncbi:MAG: hypothetical protein KY469_02150 [Actinobacteria bacterium]|nr:hypothetical protein [Actinomycetota bacterium]